MSTGERDVMKLFHVEIGRGHWIVRAVSAEVAEALARRGTHGRFGSLGACEYGTENEPAVVQELVSDGAEAIVVHASSDEITTPDSAPGVTVPFGEGVEIEIPVNGTLHVMCGGKHCKGANPSAEPHACPYASEIGNNSDPEFCTCCKECERECADDI